MPGTEKHTGVSTRGNSVSKDSRRQSGTDTKDRRTMEDRLDELLSTMITREYLDNKISQLKKDICVENKEITDRLEARIFDLETDNDDLRKTVDSLEGEITRLHVVTQKMEYKLNDLEQHGRKDSLRIIGLEDPSEKETVEECVEKIVSFVTDKLEVNLTKSDINIAHRLGHFSRSKPRSIIVKFTSRRKKHDIIRARKKLRGSGKVIFEDLTRDNQQFLKDAFKLECVKNTYSVDGKLFAVLVNGKKRRLFLDTPLEEKYLLNDENFRRQ
ncbi:227 kDa spindle- and centromere-associated protein-like [Argopecten irradians]|uniref:227 kDa spindle- and centromere-associated protein-like n=1 Tax=Argopecten irradians TaxID=31199 RepID=UPI00371ACD2C